MNLIDRDALIAKLEITERCIECKWVNGAYCNRWNTFADACEAIFEAPVIEQPEIIYCEDCRYWDAFPSSSAMPQLHECHARIASLHTAAHEYCSRAERREG